MPLEAASIQALTPKAAPYKVADGHGLYLLVQPNGARYWRFRYRWAGKQNTLSCGVYPDVTPENARDKRDAFRAMLAQGINPGEYQKAARAADLEEQSRRTAATRFMLDSDGALSVCLGNRRLNLTPAETADLRTFLDATRGVNPKR